MGSYQQDRIVRVHEPLCEDGGEGKEGSLTYLRVVGQRERKM